jgi:hypothetical protein
MFNLLKFLAFMLIMGATNMCFANSVQFCSPTNFSLAQSESVANGPYTATLSSGSTITAGACATPTPTPSGACLTVPSATVGIPHFTRLTGSFDVNYFGGGSKTVDVTSFDAFYGPWPGNPSLTADISLPVNYYLSEHFHVPATFFASRASIPYVYGNYTINASGFSAAIAFSISTTCGDFSNPATNPTSTVVPGCWKDARGPYTPGPLQWRKDSTCVLHDNTDYYLNIINAKITNVGAGGTGTATSTKNAQCSGACSDPISDGPQAGTN